MVKQKSKHLVRTNPVEDCCKERESISGNTKPRDVYKGLKGTYSTVGRSSNSRNPSQTFVNKIFTERLVKRGDRLLRETAETPFSGVIKSCWMWFWATLSNTEVGCPSSEWGLVQKLAMALTFLPVKCYSKNIFQWRTVSFLSLTLQHETVLFLEWTI